MSERTNPNKDFPAPDNARAGSEQRTVILSDIPEAHAQNPEPAAPPESAPELGSTALAAVSQRYDILAEAGHGSMGNVYKARDRETGEIVALKLLKPEIASDQAMMERFKNELLFARKITHKNVCRVHEFNRIGGIAYTSMEFVDGESLRSVLDRFGGLPPRKAVALVLQVCSGLKEAHAQGIVHRDLKPENVMIDAQGNVKIMDFGIARSMEAVTRLTGSILGTPAYMAPEQVAGKPVDYRTDIYSLGLMMYEIFTGQQAFRADNAVAVALKQMRESPTPPHEVDPTVPVSIERAILRCIEKEPAKRFQSIAELVDALRSRGGSSAAIAPAAASPGVPVAPPGRATLPLPPQPLRASSTARKHVSPVVWLFLGGALVFVALAGWRWVQVTQAAENLLASTRFPAPKPPDFALNVSAPQPATQPAAPKTPTKPATRAATKPTAPAPDAVQPALADAPPEPAHRKNQPKIPAQNLAPQDVQEHADKVFGETPLAAASPAFANNQGYLWVGRFEREDRAQSTAKKLEDLGLSVVVMPRHNDQGKFFVVLTGPFAGKRLQNVLQQIQGQGFPNARIVKAPGGNQYPNQNQRPNPGLSQKPNS
ncbi:MAG: protein kinase [Candidatus Acidiferrales bacterium]